MTRKIHFSQDGHWHAVCADVAMARRFQSTGDTTRVTCKRCQAVIARRSLGPMPQRQLAPRLDFVNNRGE